MNGRKHINQVKINYINNNKNPIVDYDPNINL